MAVIYGNLLLGGRRPQVVGEIEIPSNIGLVLAGPVRGTLIWDLRGLNRDLLSTIPDGVLMDRPIVRLLCLVIFTDHIRFDGLESQIILRVRTILLRQVIPNRILRQ